MKKILNKTTILILSILCINIFISGCTNKPPEGIDKDLWRDSVKVVKIIKDTFDKDNNFSVKDEEAIEEYFKTYKGRLYDNIDENILVNNIYKLYDEYGIYISRKKTFSNQNFIDESKNRFINLLDKLGELYENLSK